MNARSCLLLTALVAALAAGGYHWRAIHAQSRLESDVVRVVAETKAQRQQTTETSRQIATARDELQALLADRMNRGRPTTSPGLPASPPRATTTPLAKSAVLPPNPELRRMQVQAFVSDQRLRFAGLLKRLGFTSEKLQAFDRIEGACQQVILDHTQTEVARQQARQTRDAQLAELFGVHHDQWIDANRNQPARAIVARIVEQTFQSSGALTTAQADELTRIVAQHHIPPAKEAGVTQPRYDWDRIIADAGTILADRQKEAFVTAVEYRRASDKMSAMAAKKK